MHGRSCDNVSNHFERQKWFPLTSVKRHFTWGPFDIRNKPSFSMHTFDDSRAFLKRIIFMESSFIFKSLNRRLTCWTRAGGKNRLLLRSWLFILFYCFVCLFTSFLWLFLRLISASNLNVLYDKKKAYNIRHYFIVSEHICWSGLLQSALVRMGGLNASHWKSWSAPEITRACCAPLHPLPWIVLTAWWRANVKTSLFLNLTRKSVIRKQHDRR